MSQDQLRFSDLNPGRCLFKGYVDDDDLHCNDAGMGRAGYHVIAEDSSDIGQWLAEIRWVDIGDVQAQDIPISRLPAYIPTVTGGSAKLFHQYRPPAVAVKLADVVSPVTLSVTKSLEKRFGIPPGVPVVLQAYSKDRLLENIWPHRYEVFPELAKLDFAAVTGLNYSVWMDQPHAERLINIKRAHLAYEDMQALGIPAVPHIACWCGKTGLDAYIKWLADNPCVRVVAVDLQTMRPETDWLPAIQGLKYLVKGLKRPVHFLITGPQVPLRVAEIKQIVSSVTLMNGYSARKAFARQRIEMRGLRVHAIRSEENKSILLRANTQVYEEMVRSPADRTFVARQLEQLRRQRTRDISSTPTR